MTFWNQTRKIGQPWLSLNSLSDEVTHLLNLGNQKDLERFMNLMI